MKIFRLLLLLILFFSVSLFSQDYPEVTYDELQNHEYVILENHDDFFYVEINGIVYVCRK